MTEIKTLLAARAKMKARKPSFTRQDQHKRNEIKSTGWRRPKGLHSKMREGRKGYKIKISIGWKSPEEVRGMHPSGLRPVMVHRAEDLAKIDTKTQGAMISSSVGGKKKLQILAAAKGKITILNCKDIEGAIKKINNDLDARKKEAKMRQERKDKNKKETTKTIEKKVEEAPKTKDEEKKDLDKALTQREV